MQSRFQFIFQVLICYCVLDRFLWDRRSICEIENNSGQIYVKFKTNSCGMMYPQLNIAAPVACGSKFLLPTSPSNASIILNTTTIVYFQTNLCATTSNLLGLLAENGRLDKLEAVINAFKIMMAAHRGEVTCEVITAKPLDATQKQNLEAALKVCILIGILKIRKKIGICSALSSLMVHIKR